MTKRAFLSVVVPVYNEAPGLERFHEALLAVLDTIPNLTYEVLYCDDGSRDRSAAMVTAWAAKDARIKLVKLSRNFGKEITVTAGIHEARGEAILTLDADLQHPVELIPDFIAKWREGQAIVIGLRTANQDEGIVKRYGSKLFYGLFNRFLNFNLLPGETDFRLIDQTVQREFMRLSEHNRISRGLIEWLGFERSYIPFRAHPRHAGQAGQSFKRLFKLAIDSIVSLSTSPLYIAAYVGLVILPLSVLLGLVLIIDRFTGDPLHWQVTGTGYLMVLQLFLVGLLLASQAIIGLYLSSIHTESQNRPLYIIDRRHSVGLPDEDLAS